MLVKIHNSYRTTVAICDSNLLEKRFEEAHRQLYLGKNFFGGEEKTENQVLKIIEDYAAEDATFNIVGEESVNLALKSGLIKMEGIIRVQGIPTALSLL